MQLILRVIGQGSDLPVLRFPVGEYVLGRSRSCQVRLRDKTVSRRHAVLKVGPGGASVRDLDSRNGTVVNEDWIERETALHDCDLFSAARTWFGVQLLADEADPGAGCITVPSDCQGQAVEIPAAVVELPSEATSSVSNPTGRTHEMRARLYIYGPRGVGGAAVWICRTPLAGCCKGTGR